MRKEPLLFLIVVAFLFLVIFRRLHGHQNSLVVEQSPIWPSSVLQNRKIGVET